jgi:uncharacterized protein YdeI (YjbR/CyaY-like superfamily)
MENMKRQQLRVDAFIDKNKQWQAEIIALRDLLLSCELTESFKWGKPCYTYKDNNVVIIQPFKHYCALLFFKGVLIDDPEGLLVKTGVNSHVGRQIRFTKTSEIDQLFQPIKKLVASAIRLEREHIKVPKNETPIKLTEELKSVFKEDIIYKEAFEKLTPGRKRAYIQYFSSPQKPLTKLTRIAKVRHNILNGIGLHERRPD